MTSQLISTKLKEILEKKFKTLSPNLVFTSKACLKLNTIAHKLVVTTIVEGVRQT